LNHSSTAALARAQGAFKWAESSRASGGIADFDGHLLAEHSERGLDLLGLGSVFGIEHAADHPLVQPQAPGQRIQGHRKSRNRPLARCPLNPYPSSLVSRQPGLGRRGAFGSY